MTILRITASSTTTKTGSCQHEKSNPFNSTMEVTTCQTCMYKYTMINIISDTKTTASKQSMHVRRSTDVTTASGSKAKDLIKAKANDKATKYHKRQHVLLKQSTVLHYVNAAAIRNVS